jgi:L-serine dehydratase
VPFPFTTGGQLLGHTERNDLRISDVMLANELARRPEAEMRGGLLRIWRVMQDCVQRGCDRDGTLPGGLKVRRRAAELRRRLAEEHYDTDW